MPAVSEVPTLLVVRPRAQALDWVARLAALGAPARALPLIDILPAPAPAQVAAAFGELRALAAAADEARRPLLVFVSPNAVHGFFEAAGATSWPDGAWAAAIGPGTVAALRGRTVPATAIVAPPLDAPQFDSEALWAVIGAWSWPDRPVWIVRGNGGRDWLPERMREAGAQVRVTQAYARAAPRLSADEAALLAAAQREPARWLWMFSSSEALDNLAELAPSADWRAARALASHPRIAERARSLGFREVALVAPTAAAVAAAATAATGG